MKTLAKPSVSFPDRNSSTGKHIRRVFCLTLFFLVIEGAFCLMNLSTANRAFAQPVKQLTGRVLDNQKSPVPGATIVAKGSNTGVTTDADGKFTLSVSNAVNALVISYIGMTPQEIELGNRSALGDIVLSESSMVLREVVVTALGIERAAKTITYAIQKIGGDQINEVRDANFTNTLSGKIAGLTITPSANGPGGATRIVLRGNRSIQGSNNALIVVDGVPIDNSTPAGQVRNDAGGQSGSDGASSINPDDIESLNVLKGAAGAALYGSRAANGVIIITTKKGKSGKIDVNINSGVTIDRALTTPNVQNTYAQGSGGTYSTLAGGSWGPAVSGQSVTNWQGKTVNLQDYPDNIKDFFQTAVSTNNSVGISGGSDKVQTYLSYSNNYINGIVPNNRLSRNTFNGRMSVDLTNRLSVDAKVTYMVQNIYDKPGVGGDGLVVANIFRIPRSVDPETLKSYKTVNVSGVETPTYWTTTDPVYMNPYWTINNTHHDENRSRVTGLLVMRYKLTDWLNIQGRVSSDSYNDFITQKYANNTVNYARQPGGYYSEGNDFIAERNIDVLLTGTNRLTSDLKVNYNLGSSVLTRSLRHRVNIADGLGFPNKYDLSYATTLKVEATTSKRELQSVYGTAQFAYRDYLFLDLTARNDWSSTLPSPYSYFYPSVGVSAIVSEMIKLPNWISLGKVRASVTKVGNDANPYLLGQTYSYIRGGFGGYIASSSTKAISDLKPELTQSLEIGTEWGFYNNRLGIDLTYYKTNSKNQLLQVASPASSGYSTLNVNAGNIQNSGFEVMLTGKPIVKKDFTWNMGLNYARNTNKVLELYEGVSLFYLGSSANVRMATPVVKEGGSYGDLYGYKWKTLNGQYVVDANGVPVKTDAIEKLGNFNPKFTAGFSNSFTYKNWNLNLLIDGKFGGIVTSGTSAQMAYAGTSASTVAFRDANSWLVPGVTPTGETNTVSVNAEKFWQTIAQGDYSWGEFFTYDATNVRVRELTLGYNFTRLPGFFKHARLSFVARNLFFLYRGSAILDVPGIGKRKMDFDPEVSFGNSNFQGVEYYNLPSTRNIGVNLKLSF
ncbi:MULTISPECIES: SusC/RagA family TonB-linked outer membrane protein [unclassified Spirosoma]|uniref:SusC/RagA family TonB-linked outer membrane protein n=1 Tax=unclassified Spirosoma TaxID=2621999 RepID=UPI00095C80DD|nr:MULTISPECIES: SusC/RagA family TonB-linked outer membrane protein [unclassified Spirosoma]MBN8826638.1 SusC/RagA family TonB-linked outer membrane protein [Spirosoma sp.]OJW74475.1 MAG: SusC/RagA family TonB-linked outer membrane protein [Spirosoma sp. 48-14]